MKNPKTKNQNHATFLAHTGRGGKAHGGAVNVPVYHVSTVLSPTLKAFYELSQQPSGSVMSYGRRGTPTSRALADGVTKLEGGKETLIAPSGVSAISCALLSFLNQGDHVLMTDGVYAPTRVFCDRFLSRMGIETSYYDPADAKSAQNLIRKETRVIFAESPSSLTFEVQDIPALAEIAHKNNAALIADNTWGAGLYLKPLALGADVSVQSATKYLGGHADLMLGTITVSENALRPLKRAYAALGLCVGPDDVYLTLRGLRTLDVRLQRHMENALALARFLETRPEVIKVIHPALPSHPQHALWKRDFSGSTGLFGVVLQRGDQKALAAMCDGFKIFGLGYSWGGFESLAIPVQPIGETVKNIDGTLVRIHAGLEDINDLLADLEAGLKRFRHAR